MAGHSKWKNIRLHKGKTDIARGKIFGKLSRELTIAAKAGGGIPDSNPRLRFAIEQARSNSMPADNIKRAIQKGTGELESENFEEITYEGYGPGGVAVLVMSATDNKNRTVADLRHIFAKNGGNLGESGSVAWQFERKGIVTLASGGEDGAAIDEDAITEAALEVGAEDVSFDGTTEITTAPEELSRVREDLESRGFAIESAELQMVPQTLISLEGETASKMMKLIDALEDYDDVQNVAANFDVEGDLDS